MHGNCPVVRYVLFLHTTLNVVRLYYRHLFSLLHTWMLSLVDQLLDGHHWVERGRLIYNEKEQINSSILFMFSKVVGIIGNIHFKGSRKIGLQHWSGIDWSTNISKASISYVQNIIDVVWYDVELKGGIHEKAENNKQQRQHQKRNQ